MPPAGQRDEDVAAFMDQQLAVDAPVALPRETPYPFAALAAVRSPVKALGLEEVAVGSVQLPPSSGSTAVDGLGFLCFLFSTGFFMLYRRWACKEASSVPLREPMLLRPLASGPTMGRVGLQIDNGQGGLLLEEQTSNRRLALLLPASHISQRLEMPWLKVTSFSDFERVENLQAVKVKVRSNKGWHPENTR